MLDVSDNFKLLSSANGREIECKILVGESLVFTDNEIISFDFDNVIHPDYLTFGTTCANRFHFRVDYSGEIPLDAEIKPYVRFLSTTGGEDSEWCPLGVFFTTRRYARGSRVSVTAYDRMYRLDGAFTETELFPCTANTLYAHLCEEYSIETDFVPYADMLSSAPSEVTVRDVIGFIAGLNGSNAKFGRTGKLEMRKLVMCSDAIVDRSCMTLAVNQDYASLLALEIDRGTDKIEIGSAGLLSTVQMYNPFFTPHTAQRLYDYFYGFTFYGAEMRMQALPYFEAGDIVLVQQGTTLSKIVVSEVEYHYNGGFTAELVSRQKNPIEEYVYLSDLEQRINALEKKLALTCYKYTNSAAVTIRTTPSEIVVIDFEAYEKAFIQFNMTLTVTASADCECVFTYRMNSGTKQLSPRKHLHAGEPELIHLYLLDDSLNTGNNTLSVNAAVTSGNAVIGAGQLLAAITGQRLNGSGGNPSPRALITEEIPAIRITDKKITLGEVTESVTTDNDGGERATALQGISGIEVREQAITIDTVTETVTVE